jgi:protein TonB
LFQPRPVPATPFVERVRNVAGRRTLGLGLTFLIEALLLLLLLTLGREEQPGVEDERPTVVTFIAPEISEDAPEARRSEPEQRAEAQRGRQRPEPEEPRPPQRAEPAAAPAAPAAPAILPMRWSLSPPNPLRNNDRPPPPARPLYGPPDNRSAAMRDTERVGTAPNGEPLYAAEWYREPAADMMRDYLSTARRPGWGLIACRTAPDYRVEDCVALSEYPEGSQINRSVLAMAWEFRVRPPRRGGRPLVGSWVRIRIDYGLGRR